MQTQRLAVIDIGTNSIKLLVADVAGFDVRPVLEESHQTRLGHGFYETRCLEPRRIEQTAQAVAEFAAKAREQQAEAVRVVATSAAREARNSDQLVEEIQRASGLSMEIISGEQEADLAFRGMSTDQTLAGRPVLLLEVGGGSTQFILGHDAHRDFLESFPLGSVRLLERFPHSDPPKPDELAQCRTWLRRFLTGEARPSLLPAIERERAACGPGRPFQLVATGGTASILGCMEARLDHFDRSLIEAVRLGIERLGWHVEHLWRLSLEERKQIVGLPKNRADIILSGVAIYEAVMLQFGFRELRISTRGLRFGAVLETTNIAAMR